MHSEALGTTGAMMNSTSGVVFGEKQPTIFLWMKGKSYLMRTGEKRWCLREVGMCDGIMAVDFPSSRAGSGRGSAGGRIPLGKAATPRRTPKPLLLRRLKPPLPSSLRWIGALVTLLLASGFHEGVFVATTATSGVVHHSEPQEGVTTHDSVVAREDGAAHPIPPSRADGTPQRRLSSGVESETTLENVTVTADLSHIGEDPEKDPHGVTLWNKCGGLHLINWHDQFKSSRSCRMMVMDKAIGYKTRGDLQSGFMYSLGKAASRVASFFSRKARESMRFVRTETARLMWHIAHSIGKMRVPPSRMNVGNAINWAVIKHPSWVEPVADLAFSVAGCRSQMRYSERVTEGFTDAKGDPPLWAEYPYMRELRKTGTELRFHIETPTKFRVALRDTLRDIPEWKKTIYQFWADLWMLNSRMYYLEEVWDWMKKEPPHKFFAKPWIVTTVGAARFIEYKPSRKADGTFYHDDAKFIEAVEHEELKEPIKEIPKPETVTVGKQTLKIHPDKCGQDSTFSYELQSPFFVVLERSPLAPRPPYVRNMIHPSMVLAFRGTGTSKSWVINGNKGLVADERISPNGRFHRGFWGLFDSAVEPIVTPLIDGLIGGTEERPFTIVITGHSQGAAMGLITALYIARRLNVLKNKKFKVIASIFAAPTMADLDFYKDMRNSGVVVHDIVGSADPITTLFSWPKILGYSSRLRRRFVLRMSQLEDFVLRDEETQKVLFDGRVWTDSSVRRANLPMYVAQRAASLEGIDSILVSPWRTHLHAYFLFTILLARKFKEASYGSYAASTIATVRDNQRDTLQELRKAHKLLPVATRFLTDMGKRVDPQDRPIAKVKQLANSLMFTFSVLPRQKKGFQEGELAEVLAAEAAKAERLEEDDSMPSGSSLQDLLAGSSESSFEREPPAEPQEESPSQWGDDEWEAFKGVAQIGSADEQRDTWESRSSGEMGDSVEVDELGKRKQEDEEKETQKSSSETESSERSTGVGDAPPSTTEEEHEKPT